MTKATFDDDDLYGREPSVEEFLESLKKLKPYTPGEFAIPDLTDEEWEPFWAAINERTRSNAALLSSTPTSLEPSSETRPAT